MSFHDVRTTLEDFKLGGAGRFKRGSWRARASNSLATHWRTSMRKRQRGRFLRSGPRTTRPLARTFSTHFVLTASARSIVSSLMQWAWNSRARAYMSRNCSLLEIQLATVATAGIPGSAQIERRPSSATKRPQIVFRSSAVYSIGLLGFGWLSRITLAESDLDEGVSPSSQHSVISS